MKKLIRILTVVFCIALLLDAFCFKSFVFSEEVRNEISVNQVSVDGPFVLDADDSKVDVYTAFVSKESVHVNKKTQSRKDKIICEVDNKQKDEFSLLLNDSIRFHSAKYKTVEKIFVMSDLHGSFNAMSSLLINNGVINSEYEWSFGDGHLVMVGDITDRGKNMLPCLWLFYKLEQENPNKIHYLYGNHELMTLYGRAAYLNEKTKACIAKITGKSSKNKALKMLFSESSELGRWLRARNTIEIIGDILFVHGGLSTDLVNAELTIEQINNVVRKYADVSSKKLPKKDAVAKLLFGRKGPMWYRGMVMDYKKHYKKMTQEDFNRVLSYFDVKKVIVGHTEVDNVSTDYNQKLIRVNVHQPSEKNSGDAQALLVESGKYYRVNGKGERVKL